MRTSKNLTALKIILVLIGLFIIGSGLNIGLGGISTLGWGGQKDFIEITNVRNFLIQDSHIRFVGGLWLGVGLFFLLAATNPPKYKQRLQFAFVLIFLGGILRLFQFHSEVTFGLPVVGSLIAELVGMPLMYWWTARKIK
jgi:hypothetical protein